MKHLIWMMETACLGAAKCGRLLARFGSGEAVYRASAKDAAAVCELTGEEMRLFDNKSLTRADIILGRCSQMGARAMSIFDQIGRAHV